MAGVVARVRGISAFDHRAWKYISPLSKFPEVRGSRFEKLDREDSWLHWPCNHEKAKSNSQRCNADPRKPVPNTRGGPSSRGELLYGIHGLRVQAPLWLLCGVYGWRYAGFQVSPATRVITGVEYACSGYMCMNGGWSSQYSRRQTVEMEQWQQQCALVVRNRLSKSHYNSDFWAN